MPPAWHDLHGNDSDGRAAVESAPLFTGVSPEDVKRISDAGRLKRFPRGEMPYLEGDTVKHVSLLISGSVKITKLGPKGLEVILRLAAPGDVFDVVSLFAAGRHSTTAQAIRGCWALVWEAGIFKDLAECHPVVHQNIIRFICGHFQELEERFHELATERVAVRVARQLIRLQEQVGSVQKGKLEIGLTLEGLAQMTGTTVYTVSRLLSVWEGRSLVSCRRESMMISDVRTLREILEEN